MDSEIEVEVLTERRSAFRIFHKMPFRLQTGKSPRRSEDTSTEEIELKKKSHEGETPATPLCQRIERQLSERAKILDCEKSESDDENDGIDAIPSIPNDHVIQVPTLPSESGPDDEKTDIYGKLNKRSPNEFEKIDPWLSFSVYIAWTILILFAYFRDFLKRIGLEDDKSTKELEKHKDFVPLFNDFEALYSRNMYIRVRDVFERPIGGVPGATVKLIDRTSDDNNWTYQYPGTQTDVINVSSYNYLGFAQAEGPCAEASADSIDKHGVTHGSSQILNGRSREQEELESLVADFLGVDEAICFSMGFATNSMNTPCLADKHTLIVSDQRNHVSLILGCRMSGANIKVFKHNDVAALEKILRDAIAYGNPKTHRPYRKLLIIVEGIYSMEGSICDLPSIIALKKKYGAYLYLDEAHSIGAMGATGRGVVEYWGCDPKDVDILMGTFTKSFGSAGGYIAGSKKTIDHLRVSSPTGYYSGPMSPPIARQIIASMSIVMGRDGTGNGASRIERLARNARYFRLKLKQSGFIVYGSDDSPVVPMMIYYPAKCGFYGRSMLARGVGIVVVSFPATEMNEARCRFCVSAAHTKEQLDEVLRCVNEVADNSGVRYSRRTHLYKDLRIEW